MKKEKLLNAALSHFEAERSVARANLDVYLESAMAIGDHPNIVEEVMKLIKKIANAEECIKVTKEERK